MNTSEKKDGKESDKSDNEGDENFQSGDEYDIEQMPETASEMDHEIRNEQRNEEGWNKIIAYLTGREKKANKRLRNVGIEIHDEKRSAVSISTRGRRSRNWRWLFQRKCGHWYCTMHMMPGSADIREFCEHIVDSVEGTTGTRCWEDVKTLCRIVCDMWHR